MRKDQNALNHVKPATRFPRQSCQPKTKCYAQSILPLTSKIVLHATSIAQCSKGTTGVVTMSHVTSNSPHCTRCSKHVIFTTPLDLLELELESCENFLQICFGGRDQWTVLFPDTSLPALQTKTPKPQQNIALIKCGFHAQNLGLINKVGSARTLKKVRKFKKNPAIIF